MTKKKTDILLTWQTAAFILLFLLSVALTANIHFLNKRVHKMEKFFDGVALVVVKE